MAKDSKPDASGAAEVSTPKITVASIVDGYERCGVKWTRLPQTVEVARFTDVDLRSLRIDPTLSVVDA